MLKQKVLRSTSGVNLHITLAPNQVLKHLVYPFRNETEGLKKKVSFSSAAGSEYKSSLIFGIWDLKGEKRQI